MHSTSFEEGQETVTTKTRIVGGVATKSSGHSSQAKSKYANASKTVSVVKQSKGGGSAKR